MPLPTEPGADIWVIGQRILGVFLRLFKAIKRFIAVFVISSLAYTIFPIQASSISLQQSLAIGWLANSVSAQVLHWLLAYLVPHGEQVYALGPFDVFNVLMMIGALLGLLTALPVLAFDLYRYFGNAFYAHERRMLRNVLAMGVSLFAFGVLFGLLVLLPPVFFFAYQLQVSIGAQSGIGLSDLFETTMMFSLALGLVFQVPSVSYVLAKMRVLRSAVMRKYRFVALMVMGTLAFVISPGTGGGIVESIIFGILYALFEVSIVIVSRVERGRTSSDVPKDDTALSLSP